ncbi:MAG: homocysteine S-methyltransferase family protein [Alphaproteobacteria bacterium]
MMRSLKQGLKQRLLLADGSVSRILAQGVYDKGRDLMGVDGLTDALNLMRNEIVVGVHKQFLKAGADVIRTNTLASSPLSLARVGLAEEAFLINYTGAQAAAAAIDAVPGQGRRRFVLGVVRNDGWPDNPQAIEQATDIQVQALIAGGCDGVLIDTLPGVGSIQATLNGALAARAKLDSDVPVFLQGKAGAPSFGGQTIARCDGLVGYASGDTRKAEWIERAVADAALNLISGSGSVVDTVRLDSCLRSVADDGFRPERQWFNEKTVREEFAPVSSWRQFPEEAVREPAAVN